ncbi:MAG: iron-only hydrogenase system regulator [Ruminococcus sp.]|nr:iron-only hydrogenase system regulator [Ruminococcus sp.]MBQ1815289.1 iron-only hydrogenase system regulator [Ruminococcus sp.]MEE1171241.1 TM1266 family iron-only hydrogenase system putative regulator [Ruminococcus sp.]
MEGETTSNRVAVISIIVEESERVSEINDILHSSSDFIIGRMGIPYREKNISIISIVIDAPMEIINSVSGKLGRLSGVTVKTAYSKS